MKPILDHQIKFLKFCGIFESIPRKWIYRIKFFRSYIIFATLLTTAMVASFTVQNYNNILEITECIAPLVSAVFMLIKYGFLIICSDKIFDMIKEIEELNVECKILYCELIQSY